MAASTFCPFQRAEFTVPYHGEDLKYEVLFKPIWEWILELLRDPLISQHFHFHAERKFKESDNIRVRFIDEPWTADKMWKLESELPDGGVPILIVIWIDKGRIGSFGGRQGYPAVARCANLPVEIRNSRGFGGGRMVGWAPIVETNAADSGKTSWANHKRQVWHIALSYIIASMRPCAAVGHWWRCFDAISRCLFPTIFAMSLDYEEQAFATLNRGVNTESACPSCETPTGLFATSTAPGKLRTVAEYYALWKKMQQCSAEERDKVFRALGIVDIKSTFYDLPRTDIFRAMLFEPLHADEIGVWRRLWNKFIKPWFEEKSRPVRARVEERIANLPGWSGLRKFPNVLSIDFADGSKYGALLRIILHGIHLEFTEADTVIIECIRSKAVLYILGILDVHTDDTIEMGRREIENFAKLLKRTSDKYGWTWNVPKVHALLAHLFDDISNNGATRTWNAKPNEQLHKPLKRAAQRFNDGQATIGRPLTRRDHYLTVLSLMQERLDLWDARSQEDAQSTGTDSHISLRGVGATVHSGNLPEALRTRPGFSNFKSHLEGFLTTYYCSQDTVTRDTIVSLGNSAKITEYYSVYVRYASEVDWRLNEDILHRKDNFHGARRHDCIILQGPDGLLFARLLMVFTCVALGTVHPMALITVYDPVTRVNWKDRALGFRRVREPPTTRRSEFIFLSSVIRGAYLVSTHEREGEFYVNDLIDADMFLRLLRHH